MAMPVFFALLSHKITSLDLVNLFRSNSRVDHNQDTKANRQPPHTYPTQITSSQSLITKSFSKIIIKIFNNRIASMVKHTIVIILSCINKLQLILFNQR